MPQKNRVSSAPRQVTVLCLAILLPLLATPAFAEPLAQVPLYSLTTAEPNVFFLNDDSSSMDEEIMVNDTPNQGHLATNNNPANVVVEGIRPLPTTVAHPGSCEFTKFGSDKPNAYAFVLQTDSDACDSLANANIDPKRKPAAEEEWRVRFHEINQLYYDPTKDYAPWPGINPFTNQPFAEMTLTDAWIEPAASSASGNSIDLTHDSAVLVGGGSSRTYYTQPAWTTWCNNNLLAGATCKQGWRYYYRGANGKINLRWVTDLSNTIPTGRTRSESANFANWFTYHRNRKNVAKNAIGTVVSSASANNKRLGYGAINDINQGTMTDIATIDFNNKGTVLEKLYRTFGNGSTPLQKGLKWVGDYYEVEGTGDTVALASPILGATNGGTCRFNSTVLLTDGFYSGARTFNNSSDAVGNTDRDAQTIVCPGLNNSANAPDTNFDGPPYADCYQNTLADIAMHYYERDLAGNLANKVPSNTAGVKLHQHMITHTISFGLEGTISSSLVPGGDLNNLDISTITAWPDPEISRTFTADDAPTARIDDLFHAAKNGRGKYFSAMNPTGLKNALDDIINTPTPSPFDSSNTIATSAFHLGVSDKVFVTRFNSTQWSGEIEALSVNADGTLNTATPVWNSNTTLTFADHSTRKIMTYDSTTGSGIPFKWANNIATNTTLSGLLDSNTATAELRLNYLRGQNISGFRSRAVPLGDIINSSPVYVGAPAQFYPDAAPFGATGNRYSTFWNNNNTEAEREAMVYVGANDGMLHGFRVSDGEELLAYIPRTVFGNLKNLTLPTFDSNHLYFVDQSPTVSDAFFQKHSSGTIAWHTVLVSGLGAGGRGIFALDITNPTNFTDAKAGDTVLWELSSSDDGDLGYTVAKPVIAMTENNQWVAISGNGYGSDNGDAALFIIPLNANPAGSWTSKYTKLVTGNQTDNGLFSPAAVDSDGNGKVDHVYAGDLLGNIWVFDLKANTSRILFSAADSADKPQPITTKPTVIRHPTQATTSSNAPNMMVYFGTGRYLTGNDLTNSDRQGFYAVWDDGHSNLTRTSLTPQAMETGRDVSLNINARRTTDTNIAYTASGTAKRYGWYIDLPAPIPGTAPSERVISAATVYNGIVLFSTYTPSSDPCVSGGKSWFMFVKALNGGPSNEPIISLNNDRLINTSDLITLESTTISNQTASGIETEGAFGFTFTGDQILINTTDTNSTTQNRAHNLSATGNPGKRISWRELRRE